MQTYEPFPGALNQAAAFGHAEQPEQSPFLLNLGGVLAESVERVRQLTTHVGEIADALGAPNLGTLVGAASGQKASSGTGIAGTARDLREALDELRAELGRL